MRRTRGGRLEVAGGRWDAGQGAVRGEKTGKNSTDWGKPGTKKSLLVEGDGGPLGAVIAGANMPDCKLLDETIAAVMVEQPDPEEVEQHLCLDALDNPSGRDTVEKHGYVGHIRPTSEDRRPKRRPGRRKTRRWVVERTLSWLSKCRGLLVRYDNHPESFLGLIQLVAGSSGIADFTGYRGRFEDRSTGTGRIDSGPAQRLRVGPQLGEWRDPKPDCMDRAKTAR